MTSPPDPRRRLTSDELIAMFVAFVSIGSIFFWATRQPGTGFDIGSLLSNSPQPAPSPLLASPAPDPDGAIVTTPPNPQAPPVPQPEATSAPQPNTQTFVPIAPIGAAPSPSPSSLPNLVPSPTTPPEAAKPVTGFKDVPSDFWAGAYIGELTRRNILSGFQDGTFKPNEPISRAQFAALLGKAFGKPKERGGIAFRDVPANFWARSAIDDAIQTGFMSGYSEGVFRPNQQIPLYQLQVALASGLKLQPPTAPAQTLAKFKDVNKLPKWAQGSVAAAVESGLVTGFPSAQQLTPNRVATRADAAALLYQALVREGRITPTK
ncbi:S-layer homology domain-containing protein [Leptolyngbya sp. FACHB-17]|uniref:S-layer homology domain-containing protein n=1 Tax=unclassified Leptolyngbya TaxID=2650499 RepID=UPI00168144A6|nr:S-layer homology domain-containing protein [Leptolyngbya sp. FACHB-17]MBD2081831.1 S-layer homology domain-containing protein [Leptolyngbya sp. FACHB-17]